MSDTKHTAHHSVNCSWQVCPCDCGADQLNAALKLAREVLTKALADADRIVAAAEYSASRSGNELASGALPTLRERAESFRSALAALNGKG